MRPQELKSFIKTSAAQVGFDRCGIARTDPIGRADYLQWWVGKGMAGSMGYLHRNLDKRLDPAKLLPGAKSAIVVALNYKQQASPSRDREAAVSMEKSIEPRGRIAMYAWGEDYHVVLRDKLRELETKLREEVSKPFDCRICVDTAPIIERELAAAAGVGWIGKNTMAIHPELGSYFFLGVILTTLDIAADAPLPDHCGTCTACLDACPTQTFFGPYQMDASRCISYLTIEHRGDISGLFQEMMGDWIFGCDVCQDVCPHNRKAPDTREPRFATRDPAPTLSLQDLLTWNDSHYREKTRDSAISRAKLEMLKRNARIVLRVLPRNNPIDAA